MTVTSCGISDISLTVPENMQTPTSAESQGSNASLAGSKAATSVHVNHEDHEAPRSNQLVTDSTAAVAGNAPGSGSRVGSDETLPPQMPAAHAQPVMHAILRSKGFVWLANYPSGVYFWSHAGQVRYPRSSIARGKT
jgi:hypothetical protein